MTVSHRSARRALLAAAGGLLLPAARVAAAAAPGDTVVWPTLTFVDGSSIAAGDWNDVAAIVVFWATWCPYCRRHNPRIDRLYRERAGAGLRVFGVAIDGDAALIRRTVHERGYTMPTITGDGALRERFTTRRVVPLTAVVGRDRRLLQLIPGEMAEDDVMALADAALAPRPR